jgi:gluconate 5-dehydrogenase
MKNKRSGRIINVASLFGILAPIKKMHLDLKNEPPISMVVGKGGIIQFTKYLASILAEFNILVNTVSPGWFPKKHIDKAERKDYLKEMENRIPLNRIGKPTEISGVICFLASEKSSYITGQNHIVDGGYSIW